MSKTNRLAKECVLLSMEEVKNAISSTYDEERLEKLSIAMKNLVEA